MKTELEKFVEKWGAKGEKPKHVRRPALQLVEAEFEITLPSDYSKQMIAVGAPWTPSLLDAIVATQVDLHDLSELYTPRVITSQTQGWHAIGLPGNLLAIGSDCMGSQFCFDMDELKDGAVASAEVIFWDHDFNETEKVASSFTDWLSSYLGPWSEGFVPD